jgi:hypothetical protein
MLHQAGALTLCIAITHKTYHFVIILVYYYHHNHITILHSYGSRLQAGASRLGIAITNEAPHCVLKVTELMDANGRLQGEAGGFIFFVTTRFLW